MQDEQYSPIFSQYTQEESENIDVIWDWNSPQSKPRTYKHKKKTVHNSPKLPVKRHPSNNQIDVFNKLKEEFEMLKSHVVENASTKSNELASNTHKELGYKGITNLDDIFNDSMEEQLVICSQNAEHELQANENLPSQNTPIECANNLNPHKKESSLNRILFNDDVSKPKIAKNNNYVLNEGARNSKTAIRSSTASRFVNNDNHNKIADDSFDFLLQTLNDEDLELNNPSVHNDKKVIKTDLCEQSKQANVKISQQCSAEEIERKRKEALAKLETKKKQTSESESPIKCSPEEIEQKRLQAIAKLEAKKKQDIIERNRQEALKRLELNKKKRALQVTSLLHK
ncbi:hypothetical protein ILUMI_13711 [Ignelater luminosus]|uniref:Uncharacterized protein n=1 Tax=Ignelater luminosus TaxID=2038154 RepID=A0A8K0CY18_IGNLU|nr:hypothetical protein ILUMI_13711 [Ignelater luminosus]